MPEYANDGALADELETRIKSPHFPDHTPFYTILWAASARLVLFFRLLPCSRLSIKLTLSPVSIALCLSLSYFHNEA